MAHPHTSNLVSTLWPSGSQRLLRILVVAAVGAILLTVSAKIKVPFYPVSMTMQPLVVLALGLACGMPAAIAAVMLYLLQGAVGFPVFTGTPERGIGLAYMVGPTGGFLAGFLVAAATTGWLADRGWSRSVLLSAIAALVGLAVIYAAGIAWLGAMIGTDKAFAAVSPYILKDVVAAAVVALAVPAVWQLTRR